MATRSKKTEPTEPPGSPEVDPETGARLVGQQIEKAKEILKRRPIEQEAIRKWEIVAEHALEKAFGKRSQNAIAFTRVGRPTMWSLGGDEAYYENIRFSELQGKLTYLEGQLEVLLTEQSLAAERIRDAEPMEGSKDASLPHRVFLVHGHNELILHEVARFLDRLGLETIILKEQPNEGRTIIEKFIELSDVGFGIVLLTPDDRGGKASDPFDTQQARARQNVIFELGYFIGKLGRKRVAALYMPGVEVPSDYSGVLFTLYDSNGAWKLTLARELKAADFSIDMNKAC